MRLLAYRRYSPRPVLRHSMEIQEAEIKEWSAAKGHEIVGWFEDAAVSGDTAVRQGRDALLAAAAAMQAEGIVVANLSRWTRQDAPDAFRVLADLRDAGIQLKTVTEDWLDLSKPFGWSILALLLDRNNLELETIRANTRKGSQASRASGIWHGRLPWGWRRVRTLAQDGGTRVPGTDYGIEPAQRGAIRKMFEARASGMSTHTIGRRFEMRESSVREILRQERNQVVVGEDLWQRAQVATTWERHDSRGYLLAGLMVCPWCGRRMIGCARKGYGDDHHKNPYYQCRNFGAPPLDGTRRPRGRPRMSKGQEIGSDHPWRSVSERLFIRHLNALLESFVLSAEDQGAVVDRLAGSGAKQQAAAKAREKALRSLELQRKNIERGVATGTIRVETAKDLLAELLDREAELPPPPVLSTDPSADVALLAGLMPIVVRARQGWPDEPEVSRAANAILREVIHRIEWPIETRRKKYQPRIVLRDRYAAIWSAMRASNASSASRLAAARAKRVISSASGDAATVA